MKLEFFQQTFKKYLKISKFHENPSSASQAVPCGRAGGQTGRHGEENSRFSRMRLKGKCIQLDF